MINHKLINLSISIALMLHFSYKTNFSTNQHFSSQDILIVIPTCALRSISLKCFQDITMFPSFEELLL